MDSPETDKAAVASTSPDPNTVQDSPIFSYISNLSPIKPVKAAPIAQGFPGLNSPPLVFTSPRINARQQSLDLKRPQCRLSSRIELSQQDDKGKNITTVADESEKSTSQMSSGLNPHTDKEHGGNSYVHDQAGSPSGCVDEYLADHSQVDCADSTLSDKSSLKQSEDVPRLLTESVRSKESVVKLVKKDDKQNMAMSVGASPGIFDQAEEDHQGKSSSHVKPVESNGEGGGSSMAYNLCPKVESDFSVDHAFDEQHYEQPVTKASQSQLGMRRRLQFEEVQHNIITNHPVSWNPSNSIGRSRSPASPLNSEVLDSSCVDIPATPSNIQLGSVTQSTHSLFSPQNNRNSSLTVSKPSGIGLHLNSIVNALPVACGSTASIKSAESSYLSARGKKSISIRSCHLSDNIKYCSVSSNSSLVENVLTTTVGSKHESPASCPSSHSTKSLKLVDHQATFFQGKANSEHADIVEVFNQSSPRKKRKKTESTSGGDGCKRCNCKKTKCLKLYCDCFAAGIYCAEPCACQGCFNRPEYEDTVLETRQQIESRNPLAFAPKIVQRLIQPPASLSGEDGNRLTPLSGRHKRGCNCKKSMCLKKYCECYQANVGCSDGCRCEGCKNVFGKKEVGSTEAINEKSDGSLDDKLEMVATRKSFLLPEFRNLHNLTPLTPSFQCSDHGKDVSNSRLLSGGYLPSPESEVTFLPPHASSPRSPRDSNHDMILETSKEILHLVPFDQESKYGNAEVVDEFSPRCLTGQLTALPNNPPPMDMASLVPPKTRDWVNGSRAPLPRGSGCFSSVSSLHWRSSPITPVTPFIGTKLHQVTGFSDDRLYDITEDDTPEILKDSSTPLNTVKVSSPNKKRVSPPHYRLHEVDSSSLRSGRKFILQAIPSFPPLTPCIDSKDSSSQDTNHPRDSSCNE